MDTVKILPADSMGSGFVPKEFLRSGADDNTVRNEQFAYSGREWRQLTEDERSRLKQNGNRASDWDLILVSGAFDTDLVRGSEFFGLVRIGTVEAKVLQHHDLRVTVGITDSQVISCDIGDLVAIHNVGYLSHFIIGDRSIINNVHEMQTSSTARFGNGIVKDGESESVRITMDLVNEAGTRAVCPFDGMQSADAYLWARYREDAALQEALVSLTDREFDSRRGAYSSIGEQSVIKNCGTLKDVRIGPHCYAKGANKLKNLTINSSEEEPSQIGEGVELVNGIIGAGSRVFYGSKAVRFVLGQNCELKYGARLIHSYLGDNSTVSCCELLNNLIFPAHEQHHNNSFLVAALVLGQSNIAAGATIGSNHNSRAHDSEIQAGRGFWPGLNTSLKHSSRFASFVLISKANYNAELDIRLPFSLVNNNVVKDELEVMPAFWWLYNMYALVRNSWKFAARDGRHTKNQHVEFETLAPDTVEEILLGRELLEVWTGMAADAAGKAGTSQGEYRSMGRRLLTGVPGDVASLRIVGQDMERSSRDAVILKAYEGYQAYCQMLHWYALRNLVGFMAEKSDFTYEQMADEFAGERETAWVNMGGQIAPESEVDSLRADIANGTVSSWGDIHKRYDLWWSSYQLHKRRHAFSIYALLVDQPMPDKSAWNAFLEQGADIQRLVQERVYESRRKDYANPFRQSTYRNEAEMTAALGTVDENAFVRQVRDETAEFLDRIEEVKARG